MFGSYAKFHWFVKLNSPTTWAPRGARVWCIFFFNCWAAIIAFANPLLMTGTESVATWMTAEWEFIPRWGSRQSICCAGLEGLWGFDSMRLDFQSWMAVPEKTVITNCGGVNLFTMIQLRLLRKFSSWSDGTGSLLPRWDCAMLGELLIVVETQRSINSFKGFLIIDLLQSNKQTNISCTAFT